MEKVSVLAEKSVRALHAGGVKELARRTKYYFDQKKNPALKDSPGKYYMDVLFINGCYLPHPSRYRVTHQREQLLAGNLTSHGVFYTDLTFDLVRNYRIFIFYRCPYTKRVGEFIRLAKEWNKTVLFDIDDLVIDKKYTDLIPYLNTMSPSEREAYEEGVELIQKTLRLCDAAITTTERLAEEVSHYVPEVYLNRNVASDRMLQLSEQAIYDRDVLPYKKRAEIQGKEQLRTYRHACRLKRKRDRGGIRLGYFSGSITHNDDFHRILPVIQEMMERYRDLELWIVGELDVPKELKPYKKRILCHEFVDWEKLPRFLASVDINLVPLVQSIFHEAKSENKWIEAALVKVPTIASKVGALKQKIVSGVTGILCETNEEWKQALVSLIEKEAYRKSIAENAYAVVKKNNVTIYTAYGITEYLNRKKKPNLVFVLPNLQISGGVLVVLKHCELLRKRGYDVTIFHDGYEKNKTIKIGEIRIPVISRNNTGIHGSIDKAVATLYSTVEFLTLYPNIKERFYFVQNFETDFYQAGEFLRFRANQTYFSCMDMKYITISKWCQKWLKEQYGKEAVYAPNGIEISRFQPRRRTMKGKIRILVEGNSNDAYKNVDESFRIIELLEKETYEIWYMSYAGEPKDWYRVDRFLHKVPNAEVASVYAKCDILLKTSLLESFSYPPLEMMATGGYVVAIANEGNIEYLKDGENCLFYPHKNLQMAVDKIHQLLGNPELQDKLYQGGISTAKNRSWELVQEQVIQLYR